MLFIAMALIIGVVIVLADAYNDSNAPPIYINSHNYEHGYSNDYNYDYNHYYIYYHEYDNHSYYHNNYYHGDSQYVRHERQDVYINEAPYEYYGYNYTPGYENAPPRYDFDTFIDIYIVTGLPGAEFTTIVDSLAGSNDTESFSLTHYKSISASIYDVYEIIVARRDGYRLVYWLSADLDNYGVANYNYPVIIINTYPDSDYQNYHTADIILTQVGGTRIYAVFMPVDYSDAPFGIVPFGPPAPPFWVEFNANQGTLGTGQSPRITIINQPLAEPPFGRIGVNFPTPPTMLGRQFVGWSVPPVGDGPAFTGSCDVHDNDLTVYARWGFEVIFNGNGITLPEAQTSFLIPDTDRIEGPHWANSSYSFAWIMRSPGSGLPPEPVPPWPVDPVRPGWNFVGWYTVAAQTGGIPHDAYTPISSTLHLFARWEPTDIYTLTFIPGPGASIVGGNTRQVRYGLGLLASTQYPVGLNTGYLAGSEAIPFVRTPGVIVPPGLNFVGWWTAPGGPNGGGEWAGWGRSATATAGITPTFMWPAGHTNPGESAMSGLLHNSPIYGNRNFYAYYVKRVRFCLNGADATFVGVVGASSGFRHLNNTAGSFRGAVVDFPATAPSNATVATHGRFMGINTAIPGFGVYGAFTEFELPHVPDRPGYTFVGWFSETVGGVEFTRYTELDSFPWGNANNRQVHARWEQNPNITLTFNANGGQWYPDQVSPVRAYQFPSSVQTRTVIQGALATGLPQWTPSHGISVPRRQGYMFLGWYEDPAGTIRFNGSAPTDMNRTFYARWSDDYVVVTFRRDYNTAVLGGSPPPPPPQTPYDFQLLTGSTWRDRLYLFTDSGFNPRSQINLRPLALVNPHFIEGAAVGGNASQQLVNPLGMVTAPLVRPGNPAGQRTMFPRGAQLSIQAVSRSGLWNDIRDTNGRGIGQWWDSTLPIYHDTTFYDIWQTEITFDRNHRSVTPTAYDGPHARMTIQVPVGYSLGNRHEHPLFEYGGAGSPVALIGPTPPPASHATAPYFTNRSDRRVWLDAPDSYTWRPRNPDGAAAVNEVHRLITSDIIMGNQALMGWNTDRNYPGYYDDNNVWVPSTGEWFDINRVLTWDNGRTYFAIWGQTVAFNIGHALAAGGVIAPEHRTRAVNFPGTWGAIEGPGQPYPIMVNPAWPGTVGLVPEFAGWNTHRDGLGTSFDRDTIITGATHLYALWRAYVYFDINTSDLAAVGGGLVSDIIIGQTVGYVEASIPAMRTNWVFREWNYENDASGTTFHPHTTQVDNLTTVYAIWDGVVTFDPNGGTMGTPSQIGGLHHAIREGQTIVTSRQGNFDSSDIGTPSTPWPTTGVNAWFGGMPANPTRLNHSFHGWWFQDDNDNWIQFTAATVMDMGNITVVARWRGPQIFSFYKTDGMADTPSGWPELPLLQGAQFFIDQWCGNSNEYIQIAGPFTSGANGRVDLVFPYPLWSQNGEFRLREVPPFGFVTPGYWRFTFTFTTSPAGDVITLTKELYDLADTSTPMFERGYEFYDYDDDGDPIYDFAGWFLGNRRAVVSLSLHKAGQDLIVMNPPPTTLAQLNNMLRPDAVFALYRYTGNGTPESNLVPAAGWVRYGDTRTSTGNPLNPMVFNMGLFSRYYQLVELVPPVNYMAPFGQWRINLTFDSVTSTFTGFVISIQGETSTPSLVRLTGEEGFVFAVGNRLQFELPLAGSSGRAMYVLAGTIMLALAMGMMVFFMVDREKKRNYM